MGAEVGRTSPRRVVLLITTALVSVAVGLAMAEFTARESGRRPRRPIQRPEPAVHTPDPVLGWRTVPGHYLFGPYSPEGAQAIVTIRPDGARDTGDGSSTGRPLVLLVGCSFTFGWAVSDDQTWAWRLQALRPDLEIENRGVEGYGTLQALLLLDELLKRGERPARVLYGLYDHAVRNVAAPGWLWQLSFNKQAVATPYCDLGAGGVLQCHPPALYPSLPFHEYLALVAMLENNLARLRAGGRQEQGVQITKLLMERMAALCKEYGIPFSIVVLQLQERPAADYIPFDKQRGIDVIDCNHPRFTAADIVTGEGHPNESVHRFWADCIAAALAEPQRLPPG